MQLENILNCNFVLKIFVRRLSRGDLSAAVWSDGSDIRDIRAGGSVIGGSIGTPTMRDLGNWQCSDNIYHGLGWIREISSYD